jgi:hypothetical protein
MKKTIQDAKTAVKNDVNKTVAAKVVPVLS